MSAKRSPSALTVEALRERGYIAEVVEYWHAFAQKRRDFCGFADILAFKASRQGVLAVQATSSTNHSARVAKILSDELRFRVETWLLSGGRIAVMSWARVKDGRHTIDRPRWQKITLADLLRADAEKTRVESGSARPG